MAKSMNEQERLQALEAYNPREHLVKIKGKDGLMKDYLPAAYRLYELSLRYPNANFSTELVYFNLESNMVIVKCRLYLGTSYEQSDKKVEACKSGLLSSLDKVETAAQARCARLFGISVEYALDMDEDINLSTSDEVPTPRPQAQPQKTPNGVRQLPPRPQVKVS